MSKRINIAEVTPNAFKAMLGLEGYMQGTTLTKTHKELIKIRTSQINGCAYCIDMHTKDALKNGETNQRIFLLNAWKETDLFTDEEKALLALTEEIVFIHKQGVTEETYTTAKQFFDDAYISHIIMMAVTINGWNRIAISTQLPVVAV